METKRCEIMIHLIRLQIAVLVLFPNEKMCAMPWDHIHTHTICVCVFPYPILSGRQLRK